MSDVVVVHVPPITRAIVASAVTRWIVVPPVERVIRVPPRA